MKRVLILSLTALSLLAGCGAKEEKTDKILLGEAKTYLKKQYYEDAGKSLDTLMQMYPNSPLAHNVKALREEINVGIAEREKRLEALMPSLRVETDDIKNSAWYYDKTTSEYKDHVSLCITKRPDGKFYLIYEIYYHSLSWLYVTDYIIKADGKIYEIQPTGAIKIHREREEGVCREWYNNFVDRRTFEIIKAIINSKEAKVRHNGKFYADVEITREEKAAMQNILNAYQALGGKLEFK